MCLRGASAIDDILNRHRGWKLRVFVVWEPVRAADSIGPPDGTYKRISDRRVRQFWDRDKVLSQRMVRDILENPKLLPDSEQVFPGVVLWDIAAVYAPALRWDAAMPKPDYYGRPVAEVAGDLDRRLAEMFGPHRR
jgi:hypothetical protein